MTFFNSFMVGTAGFELLEPTSNTIKINKLQGLQLGQVVLRGLEWRLPCNKLATNEPREAQNSTDRAFYSYLGDRISPAQRHRLEGFEPSIGRRVSPNVPIKHVVSEATTVTRRHSATRYHTKHHTEAHFCGHCCTQLLPLFTSLNFSTAHWPCPRGSPHSEEHQPESIKPSFVL